MENTYRELGVPRDKPVILQVSRFDRFKDPLGVIESYRIAREYVDIRLVLAGGGAADDPESGEVLSAVQEAAAGDPDIAVLVLPPDAHQAINALQSAPTWLCKIDQGRFRLTVARACGKKTGHQR